MENTSYGRIIKNMCRPTDQGECNSCWAISVAQVISDKLRRKGVIPLDDELNYYALHDWAIQYTVITDGCSYGSYPTTGMEWSIEKGIPLMSQSKDRAFDNTPVPGDMSGKLYSIEHWFEDDISNLKRVLETMGSTIININLYDSFDNFVGPGIYRPMVGERYDPDMIHMVAVVGYNEEDQTWIIRNSYGESWGYKGLAKIPMDERRIIIDDKIFYPTM